MGLQYWHTQISLVKLLHCFAETWYTCSMHDTMCYLYMSPLNYALQTLEGAMNVANVPFCLESANLTEQAKQEAEEIKSGAQLLEKSERFHT